MMGLNKNQKLNKEFSISCSISLKTVGDCLHKRDWFAPFIVHFTKFWKFFHIIVSASSFCLLSIDKIIWNSIFFTDQTIKEIRMKHIKHLYNRMRNIFKINYLSANLNSLWDLFIWSTNRFSSNISSRLNTIDTYNIEQKM